MIDTNDLKYRGSSALVEFIGIPDNDFGDAVYIENEYHKNFNRFLQRNHKNLQRKVFHQYEGGFTDLIYVPVVSKKLRRQRNILYYAPFLNKEQLDKAGHAKTTDLLSYLEDPDDARFLKPGFMFYKETRANGAVVYEYYPLLSIDEKHLTYKEQIAEILKAHKDKIEKYRWASQDEGSRIGHGGVYCTQETEPEGDEVADYGFDNIDKSLLKDMRLFIKLARFLRQEGVPLALLEKIIHENEKLSRIVITKKHAIILPDYNDIEINMEPLTKAVYFLFLRHPEGIIFKHLPDYREELIKIYDKLRPLGISKRAIQSIEDVTNPCLNSINEKCARIRAAFLLKFDERLAKNYYITGERGEAKKIMLPRDLVVWE